FRLCTARSIRPSRSARWISLVKSPCPPISPSGPDFTSPCVVMWTISTSIPSDASRAATWSACQRASGLPRVPSRNRGRSAICSGFWQGRESKAGGRSLPLVRSLGCSARGVHAFGLIDLSGRAEEDLGGIGESFAQRRMRMDRLADVAHFAAHFDRQDCLSDQLASTGADDAATKHALGFGLDEPLRKPFGTPQRLGTAASRPRINGHFVR